MQGAEKFASIRYADCLLTPLRSAAYDLYVSKKFIPQHSSWDEIWIFKLNPVGSAGHHLRIQFHRQLHRLGQLCAS